MKDMEYLTYHYCFTLPDQSKEIFDIQVDSKKLLLITEIPDNPPPWTRLDYQQCPNCPLDKEKTLNCPVAINLIQIVERFKGIQSHDQIHVEITAGNRHIAQETSAQQGISSLMGLLMAASNCPLTDFFKPMVRFHLPFASEEETIWRATSTYMITQALLKRKGHKTDFELKGLPAVYDDIKTMNIAITKRLTKSIEQDSTLNALILLDIFATSLSILIEDCWEILEDIFSPFLERCIESEEKIEKG